MQYLPWIIVAIVLGMAAYPIVHFVPSKQQRLRVKLRQSAMSLGIQVQIRQPNLPQALDERYQALQSTTGYYLASPMDSIDGLYMAIRSEANGWLWPNSQPPAALMAAMLAIYHQLPDFIQAVEQSSAGSTIFWQESLCEDIDQIFIQPQKLNAISKSI